MTLRRALLAAVLCCFLAAPSLASQSLRSRTAPRPLEPGFVVAPYAATGGTPSSLSFGPDTTKGSDAERLYVADWAGDRIIAIDGPGRTSEYATGFRGPLGVLGAPDGSIYVADSESAREGPFGVRPYGRVWRVLDTDGDGTADKKYVVLKDLPNGRHNTNGMAIGPDGLLYVTNGNSTDDGVEGGQSEVDPWSGSVVRVSRKTRNVSVTDLPRSALVANGWRNVYDLAFSPVDPTKLFVPMNGMDDARQGSTAENPLDPNLADSDDTLSMTDIDDRRIDDFGFPQCMFNVAEQGDLEPFQNPNPDVIKRFGKCIPSKIVRPVASFGLHTSSDGLAFQTTENWGPEYRNDLFVAEWGQLFGPPRGHDVIRVQLDKSGTKVLAQSSILEIDLPIDVTFDKAGVMYVADFSGTIFMMDRVP